ncbi:MAG TPA: hypothetical protein VHM26_18265 [Chitinophagaceae bacterium]|jgi:hypothetical protein|nr:hypothetical protein [Chitinophagaceae bacterium]
MEYIFEIDASQLPALGPARCIDGLMSASEGDTIWIKGIAEGWKEDPILRQLPVKHAYRLDAQQRMFATNAVTPSALLPQLDWKPLRVFIPVALPVSAMPGKANATVAIKLVVSSNEKKGDALLISLDTWKGYAETAPATRLTRLKFAVSEKNEVLVIGHPLPALPGKEYWLSDNMLLPCGMDWELPLMGAVIGKQLNPMNDAILLFDENASWQSITKTFFVTAKRSAVRLTKAND